MTAEKPHRRQHQRHKVINTFVVNQGGFSRFKVFDLSAGGLSFGCSNKKIPENLVIDIMDDEGLHLLDLPIEKVWSAENKDLSTSDIYGTVIGAKFHDSMLPDQKLALSQLLGSLSH